MEQISFEDLQVGDVINFHNKYSKHLGGPVKGTIFKRTSHGFYLRLEEKDKNEVPLTLYFSNEKDNEYWRIKNA